MMDERTIAFRYDTARFELYTPKAFFDLPIGNLRKLFTYMVRDGRNDEAIQTTANVLRELIEDTKAAWGEASKTFTNEYVDADYRFGTKATPEKRKAVANNRKLAEAVKRAKRDHERSKKVQALFTEILDRYQ